MSAAPPDSGYLTNRLLIAMPSLSDPNFAQSVAFVCEHSERGALALVLNKPLPMLLGDVFSQLDIVVGSSDLSAKPVLRGGPMQTDRGFVVHAARGEWDSTLRVSEEIHVTTSRDVLAAIANGTGPDPAFVALGYAGWDSGQLENEIRANAWLIAPVSPKIIFDLPYAARWGAAAKSLGVDLSRMTHLSGNA